MTREMFYFFNNMGWRYWICDDKFTVEINGEKYVFQRRGVRYWVCSKGASTMTFRSQAEVISWLDSRW